MCSSAGDDTSDGVYTAARGDRVDGVDAGVFGGVVEAMVKEEATGDKVDLAADEVLEVLEEDISMMLSGVLC